MHKIFKTALIITISSFHCIAGGDPFETIKGRSYFEEAQNKALNEGKLLLLDFYASWCMPCKWMDETTFKDTKVIDKLKSDYIFLKVNIDDMEGFELKSKFDVQFLPTILIFNQDGLMVERIEETLAPSKLLTVLNSYEAKSPPAIQSHPLNTSPKQKAINAETKDEYGDVMLSQDEYRNYFESQNQVTKKSVYQMQLGVYANFSGAERKVAELQEIFADEFIILEDTINDKQHYRILMGEFTSLEDAQNFRRILKEQHNIEGVVR